MKSQMESTMNGSGIVDGMWWNGSKAGSEVSYLVEWTQWVKANNERQLEAPTKQTKEANQPSQSINSNSTKQFIKSEVKINQLEFLFFAAVDEINKAKERNGLIDWTSGAPSSPAARQANNSTNQMLAFQLGPHLMVVLAELLLFHPAQLKNEIELVMGRRPLYRAPFHSSNSWIAFISAACSFSWRMKEKTSELEWVD